MNQEQRLRTELKQLSHQFYRKFMQLAVEKIIVGEDGRHFHITLRSPVINDQYLSKKIMIDRHSQLFHTKPAYTIESLYLDLMNIFGMTWVEVKDINVPGIHYPVTYVLSSPADQKPVVDEGLLITQLPPYNV